jgi:membrane protease YdiL (CAAX protease family)
MSTLTKASPSTSRPALLAQRSIGLGAGWAAFVVVALIAMDWLPLGTWAVAVTVSGAVLAAVSAAVVPRLRWIDRTVDVRDLAAVAVLYPSVVAALWIAFEVFTTDRVLGLFLSFTTGLLLGVGGPVVYTVWLRRRPLRSLGIGLHNLRATLGLALLFAVAQFAVTFWGYQLPAPIDWVPLLFMALPVGLFEAVFFRGFIQGTLERSLGIVPAVIVAAALYGLYHVGYGMAGAELWFLFGLGIVYAVAYRLVDNVLVLWPLLIPAGSLFNDVQAGDIALPWASIAGFADVLAAMAVIVWLATRHQRRYAGSPVRGTT